MSGASRRRVLKQAALAAGSVLSPLPLAGGQATQHAGPAPRLKLLVAGAHPDDPESIAGGTIARYADLGHDVVCLYLTRGEAGIAGRSPSEAATIRTAEAEKACALLKARARFAGQVDGATQVSEARYREFREILGEERPDLVITHWPVDTHRDHRATALLVYDAWLASDRSFALYYAEAMTGVQTQLFAPTHYVDITVTRERKRAACFAHASQDPADFWSQHEAMQRFRGREAGCGAAEAFSRQPHGQAALG